MALSDVCLNGCVGYDGMIEREIKCPLCSTPRFKACTHFKCENPANCNPFLNVKHPLRVPNKRKLKSEVDDENNFFSQRKEAQEKTFVSFYMQNLEEEEDPHKHGMDGVICNLAERKKVTGASLYRFQLEEEDRRKVNFCLSHLFNH